MLVVRPANSADFDSFLNLARQAGPGFTSLAVSDEILERRLAKAVATFASDAEVSPDHFYLLMLEDSETGEVVGLSGIKAQIGIRDPFFNFRILNVAQKSAVTNRRFDMEVLMLVNEYAGASEVGTLFVSPDLRGTGAGRLISQARYMLMAAAPERFSDRVVSELRGQVDENGHSPFWEAIGRKFFHMDFIEADNFSAEQDNQFILDLMPKYPIYAELLPEDAQAVMGQTHPAGEGAKRYLEAEGFRYNGVIDIFDGGPSVSAPLADIRTVKESRRVKLTRVDGTSTGHQALVSNDDVANFRCVLTTVMWVAENVAVTNDVLEALNLKEGEEARVWIKR